MNLQLKNQLLTILLCEDGAEITSIKENKDNTEYIWNADKAYWGRHAPILFPIVGKIKDNTCRIDGIEYTMTQHGFARDKKFDIVDKSDEKVIFRLSWSEETLKMYPFKFELYLQYELKDNKLEITYKVRNVDNKKIYFSIGAHPGFNCPIICNNNELTTNFEDYYLEFDECESASISMVNGDGLLKIQKELLLNNSNKINLSHELFIRDALIFSDLKSKKVSLKNKKNTKEMTFNFEGFPYLGIWSLPKGAPFVCIEPWFGHADFEDFKGDFKDKDGILSLEALGEFLCNYSISIL